ncbi:MAG: DMT family transporter [Candidatus Hodarchaeales archaeon]|jgi:drug/metabolite transporter (DMT)-like permease
MVERRPLMALLIATCAVSFAAILIRISNAHAFAIAFWRLLFATIIMLGIGIALGETKDLRKIRFDRDFGLLIVSGLFLAIHFASWNLSLEYTSVAASVTIVDSSPLIVVLLSSVILRESISRNQALGILLAIIGAVIIGFVDSSGEETLFGDLLAFIGAVAVAVYLIIGRKARSNLSTFSYVVVVYGICTIFLLLACLALDIEILVTQTSEFVLFLLLALGPSCLGHSLYNYALGHVRAPVVSTVTLGEAIGSTLLAILILQEIPGESISMFIAFIIGAVMLLAGVIVTLEPWKEVPTSNQY